MRLLVDNNINNKKDYDWVFIWINFAFLHYLVFEYHYIFHTWYIVPRAFIILGSSVLSIEFEMLNLLNDVQVFLIVHHAPLVRQLALIICNSNMATVSSDQQNSVEQVSCLFYL